MLGGTGGGRRRLAVVGGMLLLGAARATVGLAADIPVEMQVRGGTLALRLPGATGAPLRESWSAERGPVLAGTLPPFAVADGTGTGAGWRVSAAVRTQDGHGNPADLLVTGVAVRTLAGSPPTNAVAYPVALAGGDPVRIASAAPGSGMGTSELVPNLELPADSPDSQLELELTLTAGP